MKDFFELREEVQQLNESAMTDALNDLQDYWNANAEHFMDQTDPLYPMFSRPFDRIIKNGVLVIAINPGSGKGDKDKRRAVSDIFTGEQPPIFNNRTRTWRNIDFDRIDKDNRGGQEKNVRFSTFDADEWKKRGGGTAKFQKEFSKILMKIDEKKLASKIMMSNIVPFPSNTPTSFRGKEKELMELGFAWIDQLIKVSKPKVILTAGNAPWNKLKKERMTKVVPEATIKAIKRDDGTPLKIDIVRVGFIGKVPVIGFHHPSIGAGQSSSINFEGDQLEKIQAVFKKYVK